MTAGPSPHTCTAAITHDRLVDYWANALADDEVAAIDEQIFACDACASEAQRVAAIAEVFRTMVPPAISREQVDALRAQGRAVRDNEFEPGVRKPAVFESDVELLVHHLRGLSLADAQRVSITVRSETGGTIFEDPFAPFDRERGEVLIACQRHFSSFPHDVAIDVRVYPPAVAGTAPAAPEPLLATYFIPHEFR